MIRSMTVNRIESYSVIPVSREEHTLFFSTDPTNEFVFSNGTFMTSVTADVIQIELVNAPDDKLVISEYIENGFHISFNNKDKSQPTHSYENFSFISRIATRYTIQISTGIALSSGMHDFMYKSMPFNYGEYGPLIKECRLVYDLDVEFPATSRANPFTFILRYSSNTKQQLNLKLFSDQSVSIVLNNTNDTITDFVFDYDASSELLTSTHDNTFSVHHQNTSGIVQLSGTRTTLNANVYIHNVIVLSGKIITSKLDSNSQNNIFIGNKSGFNNQNGIANVFIGNEAGGINQSGTNNVFFGNHCGARSSGGTHNVCIGTEAGLQVKGNDNIFIGEQSGSRNVGTRNIFIGSKCGQFNVDGTNNVCVGNNLQSEGSHNILIATDCTESESYRLRIGNLITGTMDSRALFLHGSLYVNDVLMHPKTKYIRIRLHPLPSETIYTDVIIDTGCDKIDAIQRLCQTNTDVIIDCKASLTTSLVKLSIRTPKEQWTKEISITSSETWLDSFEVYFYQDRVEIILNESNDCTL